MYQTAAPRFFRAFFTSISLIFLLALPCSLQAAGTAPDLTAPGEIAKVHRAWTWNLGPSGMRGWIYHAWPATMNHDDVTAFAPFQILVTAVADDTPAAGVMAVDDVILGVSTGKGPVPLFTSDARKSLGWAIGEAEAGNGVLRFKRWRAGTVTDVSITLPVMGAFSDTAPYNCPKSATIMANAAKSLAQRLKTEGWRKDLDGREAISALALLATGDPAYMPMLQEYARKLAPPDYVAGGNAWHFYNGIFLAEYYMITKDEQVFHGLSEYVKFAARNSDLCGTTGHGFATIPPPGGWGGGRRGSIAPYGAINSAGLPVQLTIVLGKKAGVVDPEIDPAIKRASGFFGYYVNGGSIPYGEHQPFWGEHKIAGQGREYYDHRSNGKDGMCAVLFSCMDDKPAQAEYFSRMCVAGTRAEAYGHTGQGFAYLWTQLGANMGGPTAGAEFAKRKHWDRNMKRRSDGSFVYEGGEQWGAGQAQDRTVDGKTINAYWDNTYQYWGIPTAYYILHAAMPLRKLYITGKGLNPAKELSPKKVTNALWAGEFAADCASFTKEQLIAALGEYDPIVRLNAATELATRSVSVTEVNALIAMAENPDDIYQRNGACTALGCLKATSAIPALTRRLKDPDMWVRSRAALALAEMDAAALASSVPEMADAFISNVTAPLPWDPGFNENDFLQMANGFLAGTLFNKCADTMLKADKNLLYPAVRVGLKQPTGNCRGQLNNFVENLLPEADVQALFPELVECAKVQTSMDTFMGGYPPIAAMRAMSRTKVQDGIEVINDNVSFYKSYALTELPKFGEAARWTLPDLRAAVANWEPSGKNYDELVKAASSVEAATTSPAPVYALPKATPIILATPVNTPKTIALTGSSFRTTQVTCAAATQPSHGTLTGYPPNLTYTPATGYQGVDSFTYTVADSQTVSQPATVHIFVGDSGTGLTGCYYDNADFTAPKTKRVDPSINFDWGSSPPASMAAGTYSVRWTGQVLAPETGTYRFSTRTSDGVRLWINGTQLIDSWKDQATNLWNDSTSITLTAGQIYNVKMEYYNNANPATARLFWYMPSHRDAIIIPQELLFPESSVCLTSPLDGARFGLRAGQPTTVMLETDTSDVPGKVTKVSYYNGDKLIGSNATAPFSFEWTKVPVGNYRITAKATYIPGLASASQASTMKSKNSRPGIAIPNAKNVKVSTSAVAAITVDSYSVPVTENLACHFDASVGVNSDENGAVKTWQDRSGNGHHATLHTSDWNSGTATVVANQMMSLPAVQIRGGWFDIAGKLFAKEQYVVMRSPNAIWTKTGAFIGRKSFDSLSVRVSSYTVNREGTGFWDMPAACSKNGVATMDLKPITDYMIVKVTVDDRANAENLAKYPYCQIGRTEKEAGMDWDVAEIIGYSKSLSPDDEALVGGYLAAKYGIATAYPATGSLANKAATAITTTSATLNAKLMCNNNNYNVVAYWGPVDGGLNPANWAKSATISSPGKVASIDLNRVLTKLTPGTTYYFTFSATNSQHTIWAAAPLSFTTTSTAKDFLTFGANVSGSSATIDSAAGTVAWTVPHGTDLTKLAPAYTVSARAAGSPVSGTNRNFSTPQTYTLSAQNKSTKVYTVTASTDPELPSSMNATLAALEDEVTPLTAKNFGFADPKSAALTEVRITSLPAKGKLKFKETPVTTVPLTIAAADISKLTYQSALHQYGTPYTTIGIKVKNANNLWSNNDAVMTVNVTHVNHPPTSAGASTLIKNDAIRTFTAIDFPFSDVDKGNRLSAVKVTSPPTHGKLHLDGAAITSATDVPVADLATLTYTPAADYAGPDSFDYQVSDATAFSADAAMAITVKSASVIEVANGSFETAGNSLGGPWAMFASPWPTSGLAGNFQQIQAVTGGVFTSAPDGNWIALISTDDVPSSAPLVQSLSETVAVGDTVSVTFSLGRPKDAPGGTGVAFFKVDSTLYPMEFDTTSLAADSWKTYTMTKTLTNSGVLSIGFYGTAKASSWLDKIGNVTVTRRKR
jgi:hypothetical protein